MERLPADACVRTNPETRLRKEFTVEAGLLALLIEVASVGASPMQMKKPIEGLAKQFVNTPPQPKAPANAAEKDAAFKKGIGVLASTSKAVSA